jgi:quercetin dioxygenase-like cupin family protein
MPEHTVVDLDDVPVTDLSEIESIPPDLDIRSVSEALGLSQMRVTVWYFEPGEEIQYHAHAEQEEFYFVLEGEFSVKLGKSGEAEYFEATPGSMWVGEPMVGHGHRNVGDKRGVVLAVGAPTVEDPGLDPHSLDEE